MTVVRVKKTRDFTVMSNTHLRDRSLSFKAKGVLSFMLSLPEDWNYSVEGLALFAADGRDAVNTAIRELSAAGYVERSQSHDERGRMAGYEYVVHETPIRPGAEGPRAGNPSTGNPPTDSPSTGGPSTGNPRQQNTEGQSTKEPTTEGPITEEAGARRGRPGKSGQPRHRHGAYGNVLLADADLAKLEAEFPADWQERVERLDEYMESTGKRYKNHLATIRSWARSDAKREKAPAAATDVYAYDEGDVL